MFFKVNRVKTIMEINYGTNGNKTIKKSLTNAEQLEYNCKTWDTV